MIAFLMSLIVLFSASIGAMDQGRKPNRFMNRENRFLKPTAKESFPSQAQAHPPFTESSAKSEDTMLLLQSTLARAVNEEIPSVQEQAALKKQVEDSRAAQTLAFETEKKMHNDAHAKEMAAIDAQQKEQFALWDAKIAGLKVQLAAQEIQHAKEKETQRIAIEKGEARLAVDNVIFQAKLAQLRAQLNLP